MEEGRAEGRTEGRAEGESRINQLNIELSKLGRTEDILKAAVDKEYQDRKSTRLNSSHANESRMPSSA